MDNLKNYSLDAIYKMMKDGRIGLNDLVEYIREVAPTMEPSEDWESFLVEANNYIEHKIKSGNADQPTITGNETHFDPEEAERILEEAERVAEAKAVEEAERVAEAKEIEKKEKEEEAKRIEQEELEELEEKKKEELEKAEEERTKIESDEPAPIEEPEEPTKDEPKTLEGDNFVSTPNNIESPEFIGPPLPPNFYGDGKNNSYDEAKMSLEEAYRYCQFAGLTIKDISLDGKNGRSSFISFEINNESKQYLDNIMRELYANTNGISMEFMRDLSTRTEFFTIEINPQNLSREEYFARVRDTFNFIHQTIETTRKDFDYSQSMPDGLKNLKEHFRNDDPDIEGNFTIGYVKNDGKDSYYIIADNNAKALEYAASIGYGIKNNQGGNIFEVETYGSVVDTKLEEASVDLSVANIDVNQTGIAEGLDIYDVEADPRVELLVNFIETSNDPHLMCILDIEIPANDPSQRIVTMKTEMGGSESVVFTDGALFDQKVMPKIIDTYAENNAIVPSNITTTEPDSFDRASLQVESENNTTIRMNGYSEEEVNRMVDTITSKAKTTNTSNTNEYSNSKQKTIGTYPTNNTTETSAFVSMPVLFVICILFILVISLIIFAG